MKGVIESRNTEYSPLRLKIPRIVQVGLLLSGLMLATADHYTGITENWSAGTIYCSEVTGRLVVHLLGVQPEFVHGLPMDIPVDIQGSSSKGVCQDSFHSGIHFSFAQDKHSSREV